MEKLNNPPLVNVTYGIWWHLYELEEQKQSKHLAGDIYPHISNDYPVRTIEKVIIKPTSTIKQQTITTFKKENNNNFLINLANDELEIIEQEETNYTWDTFKQEVQKILNKLEATLHSLDIKPNHYHLYIKYVNFIKFSGNSKDLLNFINDSLSIKIQQNFDDEINKIKQFQFYYEYDFGRNSSIIVQIFQGKKDKENGIYVNIEAQSGKEGRINSDKQQMEQIISWNEDAHEKCESIFKEIFSPIFSTFE